MRTVLAVFLQTLICAVFPQRIPLPNGTQVEGVAHAAGSLFFAGDFRRGSILLIDFATGFTTTIVPPAFDRLATGLAARNGSIFVAGGGGSVLLRPPRMFVYDVLSGSTIAACDAPFGALVNDVIADDQFAYYTDSFLGNVYALRLASLPRCDFRVIELPRDLFARGPPSLTTNGIVRFASGLLVTNSAVGSLFFIDLRTDSVQQILPDNALQGAGGLEIKEDTDGGGATLFIAQGALAVVSIWRLNEMGSNVSASFVQQITSSEFGTPGTIALGGDRLVIGDPQFNMFPLTEAFPDDAQLAMFGFRIRRVHESQWQAVHE
ncbi:hypothetical protein FGB62_39g05 [Gracilaria domingensis]|nr:hypothetical protein FGB62_39g05 [Gracilaria domingensis]